MAESPIECLEKGKVEFISNLTAYDRIYVMKEIRNSCDRNKIVEGCLNKLKDKSPYFCFEIIYDMEQYKNELFYILEKYDMYIELNSSPDKIKNILKHTKFGKEYVLKNLDDIINSNKKNIYIILEYIFSSFDENYDLIRKLYFNDNSYVRLIFIKYITENHQDKLEQIYNDILTINSGDLNQNNLIQSITTDYVVKTKKLTKKIS